MTRIKLCNSHTQSLKLNYLSWISICAFLATASALPSTDKATDTHSYLHYDLSHPRHCKESLPYSQLLRLQRICSDKADFLNKAQEMASFFERRGYGTQTLQNDLENIKHLSQSDALTKSNSAEEKMSRIPLILTYHP